MFLFRGLPLPFNYTILLCFTTLIVNHAFCQDIGSRNRPFRIAIVPSIHSNKSHEKPSEFSKCLEDESQMRINISVPSSYIAIVEALGSKKIDLAYGDITSFKLAEKYGVEALLGTTHNLRKNYHSMILVRSSDSSLKKIKDLNGKTFAYSDTSSSSSYILPQIQMKLEKVKFSQTVSTGSMDAAILALVQNKVEAAGAFYDAPTKKGGPIHDARRNLIKILPNILETTKILWISKKIPNEPIMIRTSIPKNVRSSIKKAIINCTKKYPRLINNIDSVYEIDPKYNEYKAFLDFIDRNWIHKPSKSSQKTFPEKKTMNFINKKG